MGGRILVAYATRSGNTRQMAEAIAEELRDGGTPVDVRPAREVRDVSGYSAVILGTPVHAARTHGQALKFLVRHRDTLVRVPVAFYCVCATMQDDTPENREQAQAYLDPWRRRVPEVQPVSVGLLAGAIRQSDEAPWPLRFMLKMMTSSPEEAAKQARFLDLDAARAWAASVRPALTGA